MYENRATELLKTEQHNDNHHYTFRCDYYMGVEHKVNWYLYLPVKTLGKIKLHNDPYLDIVDIDNKYDAEKKIMIATLKVVSQK